MNFKKRITTAIATGAVLLNALAPIAAADTITVSGNGAYTNNTVNLGTSTNTVVNQTNNVTVSNNVNSTAKTGGNEANYNGGEAVTVNTGNATTNVNVSNDLNTNAVNTDCCGTGPTNVTISDNVAYSDNDVNIGKQTGIFVDQDNNAYVRNNVDADAKTGWNDANYNLGDVYIKTGDATTDVNVSTDANRNFATIGGGEGAGGTSVKILGNGAYSDNTVNLGLASIIVVDQDNYAKISNNVDADAKTGGNEANYNGGGDVTIKTGDASANADVSNNVNFNAADVDCGCVLGDLEIKVAGNNADSENTVNVGSQNGLFVSEDNGVDICNDVDADAKSGGNEANYNTGDVNGDPLIDTGDADSSSSVDNDGNVNLYNQGASLHLPGDWEIDGDFDLSFLWAFFNLIG